jgi:hypothetical protein
MRVLGSSLLAVPFVVTAVLLGSATTPVSALASPGPYPMPFQNADYDARFIPSSSPLHANPRRRSRAFDRNTTTHSGHHTFHPSTSMGTLSGHKVHASAPATPSASRFHKRQLKLNSSDQGEANHACRNSCVGKTAQGELVAKHPFLLHPALPASERKTLRRHPRAAPTCQNRPVPRCRRESRRNDPL